MAVKNRLNPFFQVFQAVLSKGDKVKVIGQIGLEGLDNGQKYRVEAVKQVAGRLIYLLRPVDSEKNDLKHLVTDIDHFLGLEEPVKPRIDLV